MLIVRDPGLPRGLRVHPRPDPARRPRRRGDGQQRPDRRQHRPARADAAGGLRRHDARRRTPPPRTCAPALLGAGLLVATRTRRPLPPLRATSRACCRASSGTPREQRIDATAPRRWFPPIMPREEFLLTDYLRSFPDLVGSIDVFTGGDKEHRALLAELEEGGDWTQSPRRPPRWCCSSSICHSLYGTLPHRDPGRRPADTSAAGSRSGTSRASTRPGCSLPDVRVRAGRHAGARRSRTATSGSSAGSTALGRARAAGAHRGRQRPVLRPGRQDAGRQPARLPS